MIRDVAARNASLDNDYGATRGPNAADSHEVALYDETGTELDDATSPGYTRATVLPADWPDAEDGAKSVAVTFDPPTDEWLPAVSWALIGDDGLTWDASDIVDPLLVTAASDDGPVVVVTVFYETT